MYLAPTAYNLTQVERKGYREGTGGGGEKRKISDQDFEDSVKLLKDCAWDFTLNKKDQKNIEQGNLPNVVRDKLSGAFKVSRFSFNCVSSKLKIRL